MNASPCASRRLFFALWPDEALREVLAAHICRRLPRRLGRSVPTAHLHITLLFLGNVPATRVSCIEEAGARADAPPFEIVLDRLGYWPRPRVFWVGPSHSPAALFQLVGSLRRALEPCGLTLDGRPFQAHMTLLRKVARPPARKIDITPVSWQVSDFALVESCPVEGGVRYRPLHVWPLAAAGGGGEAGR